MASVDIFTTQASASQWCKLRCFNRTKCEPKFYAQGIFGFLDIRVIGGQPTYECPIILRGTPGKNYEVVAGTGDCGFTPPENPIEIK